MSWHLIVRIGSGDFYTPTVASGEPRVIVQLITPATSFRSKIISSKKSKAERR